MTLPRLLSAPLLILAACFPLHAADPPNIVIILADDMGWGDARCYNAQSKIPTPHLDRLAAGGVRFTDAHTPSSVCTPTRYGLLTGRYAWRTWLKKSVLDGFDPALIEPGRATLASFLKKAGYATACIGKWHLGMTWTDLDGKPVPWRGADYRGHRGDVRADFSRDTSGGPLDCGFDSWFGISASLDMSPYAFMEGRRVTGLPTEAQPDVREIALSTSAGVRAPGFKLEDVLPEFTRRAERFIESRAAKKDEPFFLYLPLPSPHLPVVPDAEWLGKTGAGLYADFTAQTDASVGVWLAALERAGVAESTLVIFTSDNGGLWHQWQPEERDDLAAYRPTDRAKYNAERGHHSNAALRGTKADIWEGGHRVPFLVRWPARVKPAVSDALVELNDVFATVAEILGQPLPQDAAEDSFSFLSVLDGGEKARDFAVHHSLHGVFALRKGPWKYAEARGSGGFSQPRVITAKPGEATTQLYRLDTDPAETTNLADTEKETAARLARRLKQIQNSTRTRP